MKEFPLPLVDMGVAFGPGSQPDEDSELALLDIPREIETFEMPRVPEHAPADALAAAREILRHLLAMIDGWNHAVGAPGPAIDISSMPAEVKTLVGQLLGEGEVSIRVEATPRLQIQECAFTGVWRCLELDAEGHLHRDWVEVSSLPQRVVDAARADAADTMPAFEAGPGTMNAPALLAEIEHHLQLRSAAEASPAHAINLTLLPLSPEDHALLERALPVGPVAMISRGFGNCRISSTGTRDVWRVQYFNAMNTLILNKIEVVGLPEVAQASREDLTDSRNRLAEMVDWLEESVADAWAH